MGEKKVVGDKNRLILKKEEKSFFNTFLLEKSREGRDAFDLLTEKPEVKGKEEGDRQGISFSPWHPLLCEQSNLVTYFDARGISRLTLRVSISAVPRKDGNIFCR